MIFSQANVVTDVGGTLHRTQRSNLQWTRRVHCPNCQIRVRPIAAIYQVSLDCLSIIKKLETKKLDIALKWLIWTYVRNYACLTPARLLFLMFRRDQSCTDIIPLYNSMKKNAFSDSSDVSVIDGHSLDTHSHYQIWRRIPQMRITSNA